MQIKLSPSQFITIITIANIALYNLPLFSFAIANMDAVSVGGVQTLLSMILVVFMFTAFILFILFMLSHYLVKPFCILMVMCNSVALYFVVNYQVILDRTMMGNILNTRYSEAADFFSWNLLLYIAFLGLLPAWLILKVQISPTKRLRLNVHMLAVIGISLVFIYLSSSTWLWFDKNAKQLGGRIMPWSYAINLVRYQTGVYESTKEQILLPPAELQPNNNNEKNVVLLVIGESARAQNFSLYGYGRNTNPLLAKSNVIALKNATACSTYTTASVGCILSHIETNSAFATQYEPLPSYLQRHGVDVIWRTKNWGEPRIEVQSYEKSSDLEQNCKGEDCEYDGVLLTGLKVRISSSKQKNVFVVLHQSGSHGPSYFDKYPKSFEVFKPVCKSVELRKCSDEELINAYDNTILYTDYFVNEAIDTLKSLENTSSVLMYLSDHGESLGEYGVYLHGTPYSIAPVEQKDIPFLV